MEAHAAGEEAVAVGVLDHVVLGDVAHPEHALHALAPELEVGPGVGGDDRLAGGPARHVEAHDLVEGHRQQPEGIGVPEVLLAGEGHLRQLGERPQRFGRQAVGVEGDPPVQVFEEAVDLFQRGLLEDGHGHEL